MCENRFKRLAVQSWNRQKKVCVYVSPEIQKVENVMKNVFKSVNPRSETEGPWKNLWKCEILESWECMI